MPTTSSMPNAASLSVRGPKYNFALGYLRAFVVVLVVAHHALLAYFPYAPPVPVSLAARPLWWTAFPVVDTQRWAASAFLVSFNDIFFMSLMFFLSGLFVWQGLARRGSGSFVRGRLLRLGVPFAIAAGLLAPLAYFPTYLQMQGHAGVAGFWHQWLSMGVWPAGPAWFIWVLLAFDCIAAALFLASPKWGEFLGRWVGGVSRRPVAFFAALVAVSAAAYIPMALKFNSLSWAAFGPFTFQTSRILHYFVYFLVAVGVGAWGVERGLLAADGKLARRWPQWVAASLLLYVAVTIAAIAPAMAHSELKTTITYALWVLSCAATCFAFLAIFLRFAQQKSRILDSLSANSYAIYLVHYAIVSWLQFALLPAAWPGFAKATIAFAGAVALSWGLAASIRRIPAVARTI
jgi:peptidoglycan/LPS O-acetylase OafA/YrhL